MRPSSKGAGSYVSVHSRELYAGDIDVLADLLGGVRAHGAVLYRAAMARGWSIRIADGAPLMLVAVLEGGMWVVPGSGDPDASPAVPVGTGDIVIVSLPSPYVVTDDPALPPQLIALPDDRYVTPDGVDVTDSLRSGTHTAALGDDDGSGATVVVHGTYQGVGDITHRLLTVLPDVLVVGAVELPPWLLERLADEVPHEAPGQQVVLDRLLDLCLVVALRSWLERPDSPAPDWYRAHADPVIGPAMRLIHEQPAYPWTVGALATAAGVSRSWFSRRFTEVLGRTPINYLTQWRMTIAADRLRRSDATVAAVALDVGYADPFAFSTAFKRAFGQSPQEFRGR